MNRKFIFLFGALALFAACTEKESMNDGRSGYEELIGQPDPHQTWNNAFVGHVDVTFPCAGDVQVFCEGDEGRVVLYHAKVKAGAQSMRFDVPEHLTVPIAVYDYSEDGTTSSVAAYIERPIMVVFERNGWRTYQRVTMNQAMSGFNFTFQDPAIAAKNMGSKSITPAVNETSKKDKLTGPSNATIYGYSYFPGYLLSDYAAALPERVKANAVNGVASNFELESNGKFYISMFWGFTGNTARTVGYYYYNGTDTVMVPFCDALKYDYYYDNVNYTSQAPISKTQIKKNGSWYDVNYDHYDRRDTLNNKIKISAHKNDDVYLLYDEWYRNRSSIDELRAVTFMIDLPKGTKFGFYCNGKHRDTAYFVNSSESTRNISTRFSAATRYYHGYRFFGLEDTKLDCNPDQDCNDIGFVIVPGGKDPTVRLPYIYNVATHKYENYDGTSTDRPKSDRLTDGQSYTPEGESNSIDLQTWVMAFEDKGTAGDYDMNDVVIRITPNTYTHTAQVVMCATGGTLDSYVHYRYVDETGATVDLNLGEAHDLLHVSRGSFANVGTAADVDAQLVANVPWLEGMTMTENASNFYIVSAGNEYTVPTAAGDPLVAIAVPYNWLWPTERTQVSDAYLQFGPWGANASASEYWDWYTHPSDGRVYTGPATQVDYTYFLKKK